MEIITLVTPEEHKTLVDIQKNFPNLTFQNEGYQYINKSKFSEDDKKAWSKIVAILSKTILGFSKFNNFRIDNKGRACIRLQYDYGASSNPKDEGHPFIGVGYLRIDELLNGFKYPN